jgi:hypothetical protein
LPTRILFTALHDVRLYLFINENLLVTRPLQQFERFLGYNEAMFADASRSWDELDQVLKCCRRGWVEHQSKIHRK